MGAMVVRNGFELLPGVAFRCDELITGKQNDVHRNRSAPFARHILLRRSSSNILRTQCMTYATR